MAGVGIGVGVAAAAVAAAAAGYAASEQADAAEDANKKNIRQASADRQLNYQMFRESRGSEGNALLPLYAERPNGSPFEPELFADALAVYDAVNTLTPEQLVQRYGTITSSLEPASAGARAAVTGLFDGTTERQLLDNLAPVNQARTDMAESRAQSVAEALQETINEITALNARRGYAADNLANQMLRYKARSGAAGDIAAGRIQARLDNATATGNIRNSQIAGRLAGISLPYEAARRDISLLDLPLDAVTERTARSQAAFRPFVIGPGQFRYDPLPPVIPRTSDAAIAASGLSQFISAAGGLAATQQNANAGKAQNPYYGQNPGDVPWDYDGDPSRVVNSRYLG